MTIMAFGAAALIGTLARWQLGVRLGSPAGNFRREYCRVVRLWTVARSRTRRTHHRRNRWPRSLHNLLGVGRRTHRDVAPLPQARRGLWLVDPNRRRRRRLAGHLVDLACFAVLRLR